MKFLYFFAFLFITTTSFSQKVYKTPMGEKYHLATCRMVENVSEELTLRQAIRLGLAPCKICKPHFIDQGLQIAPNTPSGQQKTTVQCKGKTKKGTRCQHMTSIANGYCFQHNPDN